MSGSDHEENKNCKTVAGLGVERASSVSIEFDAPADKSLTHRAIMFAGVATGRSRICQPLLGADCLSTIAAFRQLGCEISLCDVAGKPVLDILSPGSFKFTSPAGPLDFGNSGTTARLMIGLLCGLPELVVEVIGDESLSLRPMSRVVDPLIKMGALISGPSHGKFLPLTIRGAKLRAANHEIDKASAQVKSSILLASLSTPGRLTIRLPAGGRDHTELLLQKLGAKLTVERLGEIEEICMTGPFLPSPIDMEIPGDPSSAAFFAVLGAILPGAKIKLNKVLSNPTRTGYVDVLRRMGVMVTEQQHYNSNLIEHCADFEFTGPALLRPVSILGKEVPTLIDEIPILAVAAMYADGESRFCGLAELRVKESDRLLATKNLVLAAGGRAEIIGDDLIISGKIRLKDKISVDSAGDHRLAMAASILAKTLKGESCIYGAEWVDVSFPGFFDHLDRIG